MEISKDILTKVLSQKSFSKRLLLARRMMYKIGGGSSREVFYLDESRVIKIAKNEKGLRQNLQESDWYIQQANGDVIAKTLDFEKSGIYVIQQRVEKLTKSRFKELAGFNISDFSIYNNSLSGDFFESVKHLIIVNGLSSGDFNQISSWGILNGNLVCCDYGCSVQILNDFY